MDLLTTKQAAWMATMEPGTFVKWRSRGKGPRFVKLGGKVRYRRSDVLEFIERGVVDPAKARGKSKRG